MSVNYYFKELDSDSKCIDLLIDYECINKESESETLENESVVRVIFSNSVLDKWKNDKETNFSNNVALDITRQILEWQLRLYQKSKIMITDIKSICYLDNSDLPNSDLILTKLPF